MAPYTEADMDNIEAKLGEYDFIAVIDTSSSMGEANRRDNQGGATRWAAMQEAVMGFVRDIEKLDSDGIDVVQLGGNCKSWTGVTSDRVRSMFEELTPRGSTPLAEALEVALKLAGKSAKKDFIVVFTDGVPDDGVAAARVIKDAANRQGSDDALTILFIQVGDDDRAAAYLRGLDDNLKGAKFDIVDAMTVTEMNNFNSTAEAIMKAIND